MALWQIFDAKGIAQPDQFDDGLAFMPGEGGFSTDAVAAQAEELGKKFTYALIGVPNWHARVEAEQRAAAEAEETARVAAENEARKTADAAREAEAAAALAAENAAREIAARDRIAQLLDPEGYAKALATQALEVERDALLAHASPSEAKKLKAIFADRMDALA